MRFMGNHKMLHTLLYTVHCTLMYVLLYVCTVVLLVVVHSLLLVLYSACLWCNVAADAQCLLIRLQRKSACLLPNCNEQNHSNYFCSSKISHWNSFYLPRFQIKILFFQGSKFRNDFHWVEKNFPRQLRWAFWRITYCPFCVYDGVFGICDGVFHFCYGNFPCQLKWEFCSRNQRMETIWSSVLWKLKAQSEMLKQCAAMLFDTDRVIDTGSTE